ncbi:MAG: alginate export family protein [Bacteroidota bacterium]
MKNFKFIGFFLMLIFIVQNMVAQEKEKEEKKPEFTVDAELRTRGNVLNGYKKLPTESNYASYAIEQRTRLGIAYKSNLLDMKISFQDARIWGDENVVSKTGVFGDSASIELNEAWAALKFNENLQLKIGRQMLVLDDQRLVGARNWNNNGLSYDAAAFNYKKNGFTLNLVLSYNNNALNLFSGEFNPAKMKSLNYLYLKKKISKDFYISLVNIASGYQPSGSPTIVQFKNTVGPFVKFNNKKLFAKGEFYYQLGKTIDGVDVSAYFFNAEAGYQISKIYLGAGIDYLSGQDPNTSRTEKFQAFDILYGARFKYQGNLNHIVTAGSTKYGGVMNPFIKAGITFNKKNNLTAFYHIFKTAQDVADPANPGEFYDKNLGSEIDMIYTYKMAKGISIKAGYHISFPSETMEIFKGVQPGASETPQWLWLMFSFKPTLFSSK